MILLPVSRFEILVFFVARVHFIVNKRVLHILLLLLDCPKQDYDVKRI